MKRKQRVKKLCKESDPRTIRLGLLGYSLSHSLSVLKLDEREVLEMKKSQTFEFVDNVGWSVRKEARLLMSARKSDSIQVEEPGNEVIDLKGKH
ncbi:hypothetical protein NC651_020692 [Populus alba x Populus x berolinensis]|nr:hypothetical protein NC651_020692 [Populus alba x Populus x berolinensis]